MDQRNDPSVKELVAAIKDDLTHLVKSQIALAKAEADADKSSAVQIGVFGAVAAVLALFAMIPLTMALGFGLEAAGLWTWAAFLVAGGAMLLLAGILGLLAKSRVSRLSKFARTKEGVDITKRSLRPTPPS